jgi:hypothetical protein
MADIFVSFTSSDRRWAFWIGQELEKLGHVPRIHEWEISAGGNIPKWMEESLETADHCLLVVGKTYLTKPYRDGSDMQPNGRPLQCDRILRCRFSLKRASRRYCWHI